MVLKSICEGVNYYYYYLTLGASASPSPTRQRTGQAPRGREPQKNKASGKEARQIKVNRYSKEKQQKLDVIMIDFNLYPFI